MSSCFFFFNDTATTEIYPLSLHDALPISALSAFAVAAAAGFLPGAPASAADQQFHYAVQPGTAAWSGLATHDEMVAAVQIPSATVTRMSTAQLASTVLDYPLLPDALAFDNVQQGIEVVASRFTGLGEL